MIFNLSSLAYDKFDAYVGSTDVLTLLNRFIRVILLTAANGDRRIHTGNGFFLNRLSSVCTLFRSGDVIKLDFDNYSSYPNSRKNILGIACAPQLRVGDRGVNSY